MYCPRHKTAEVKIGYNGIAIANAKYTPRFELTHKAMFFAMAKQVPEIIQMVITGN